MYNVCMGVEWQFLENVNQSTSPSFVYEPESFCHKNLVWMNIRKLLSSYQDLQNGDITTGFKKSEN